MPQLLYIHSHAYIMYIQPMSKQFHTVQIIISLAAEWQL